MIFALKLRPNTLSYTLQPSKMRQHILQDTVPCVITLSLQVYLFLQSFQAASFRSQYLVHILQAMEKSDEQYEPRGRPYHDKSGSKHRHKHRSHHSDSSDDDYHFKKCSSCSKKVRSQEYYQHKKQCYSLLKCQYCHQEWPQTHHYDHEVLCRKNPIAKAMRRKYPSSSDPSDSSDYQSCDSDGYYPLKKQVNRKQSNPSSDNQQQQKPSQAERKRESFFHHQPRRQYRLSQSSSEEDQAERFWRNFHEQFDTVPSQFYVSVYQTDLEGISISESRQGRGGRVIRRTVHNSLTGKFQTISNHRFQRHYRSHVISYQGENAERENNGPETLLISNRVQNYAQEIKEPYGLTEEQLKSLKRNKYNKTQEEEKCAICYGQYQEEEDLVELICTHRYHEECGDKWLRQNPHCPLCKAKQN